MAFLNQKIIITLAYAAFCFGTLPEMVSVNRKYEMLPGLFSPPPGLLLKGHRHH